MHLLFRPLLLAACAAGLAACHSGSSPTSQAGADQLTATAPAVLADTAATLGNSPGASYATYRGAIAGQPDSLTLHLVMAAQPSSSSRGPSSIGSYYGPDGHPYTLHSRPSAPDSLVLADSSPEHYTDADTEPPLWKLKPQADGSLAGTLGGRAIRLRRVAGQGLGFAVRVFADSLAAYPNKANSPKARIYWQGLVPAGGPTLLATSVLHDLKGDTTDAQPLLPLTVIFKQQRDTLFKDYRADIRDIPSETTNSDERPWATLNYDNQTSTAVLFSNDNLLSLSVSTYEYSGGAHGMHNTSVASYDLRTGRRLRYDDVFLPNAASKLAPLLEAAVRQQLALGPNKPLDEVLFFRQIPITKNVFLTSGGVEFVYQPYEIGAYALGEIRVFLPLGQVRPLLREGLPLPGAASVAAR